MNIRIIVSLFLICVLSICCSPKPSPQTGSFQVKFEGDVDPNTVAVVTLKLEGETLPGTPRVVSANDTSAAFFERMGSSEYIQQVTKDKWVSILTPEQSYVIGWISEDNKLFGYCSEPFVAKNNLEVTFSPGMPISLEYDLTKPEDGVNIFPAHFYLSRKAKKNDTVALMTWGISEEIKKPEIVKVDGLAPGTYRIFAETLRIKESVDTRTRFLYDKRDVEVKRGQDNHFYADYPVLDTTIEDGDVTIKGLAHNSAGEALPNEKIQLIPFENTTQRYDLYYPDAVTDANGNFEFKGIRPDTSVVVKCVGSSIVIRKNLMTRNASLWLDFLVGKLNIALNKGYPIPKINLDWKDGQTGLFSDLIGKTIVVDVWASWCAPCRKALPEFNSLAQKYKDNKDVVFVAMSIDSNRSEWEEAVDKANWNAIRHCWYDREENPLAFNKPVPYSMIIDKKGILRAEGNYIDTSAELEKVLKDTN